MSWCTASCSGFVLFVRLVDERGGLYSGARRVDEMIARIDAVTPDDVRAVAADVLRRPLALAVTGPFDDHDFSAAVA